MLNNSVERVYSEATSNSVGGQQQRRGHVMNVWRLIAHKDNPIGVSQWIRSEGVIAIGWGDVVLSWRICNGMFTELFQPIKSGGERVAGVFPNPAEVA